MSRFAIPAVLALAASVGVGTPSVRAQELDNKAKVINLFGPAVSARASGDKVKVISLVGPAASVKAPADHVKVVKITVQTTHDDKDDALSWLIEIHDGTTVYGSAEVGSGEVWPNHSATDLSITLSKSFAYADRQALKIRVTQKSSSKNYGWEGYLSVNGALGDGSVKKLITKTRQFKLGENGNPKTAEFSFE